MDQDRTKKLVAEAKKIARQVDSWISLSNALSDPVGGLIVRYFPDAEQRAEFLRSSAYEETAVACYQAEGTVPACRSGREWVDALTLSARGRKACRKQEM
jgi:hypothetical protein